MQPPDELMVRRFMPAMRQLVSQSLTSQGYSQARVSAMLGVTQASVSIYGATDPEEAYGLLSSLSVGRDEARRFVSLLVEDLKRDPLYAVETLTTLWTGLLGSGAVCGAHREMYPQLAQCDVCVRHFRGLELGGRDTLGQVDKAAKLLESSRDFVKVMPEVSVNIAFLGEGPEAPESVAAIPGRIVRVGGSAKAMNPASFGSSRHLAAVLLLVVRKRPAFKAVINLRYDRTMAGVLRALKLKPLDLGEHPRSRAEDPTLDALRRRLLAAGTEFDCVVDPGTSGIEPCLYIFAGSPVAVARLALSVAGKYSAR